jgi:hypothetical protein
MLKQRYSALALKATPTEIEAWRRFEMGPREGVLVADDRENFFSKYFADYFKQSVHEVRRPEELVDVVGEKSEIRWFDWKRKQHITIVANKRANRSNCGQVRPRSPSCNDQCVCKHPMIMTCCYSQQPTTSSNYQTERKTKESACNVRQQVLRCSATF